VLTGLITVIALFCWWSAAGKLSKKYDENQKRITGAFGQVNQVRNDPFHPNDTVQQRQEQERKKLADEVKDLWQDLYDRQTKEVLEWPQSLSQEFRDYVEKLQFGADIPQHLRSNYRDYADRYFPRLPEIIGARPLSDAEAGLGGMGGLGGFGGIGGGRGEYMPRGGSRFTEGGLGLGVGGIDPSQEVDDNYICAWLDQDVVRAELDFPERPSSMRIWVTQEDLWVYRALLFSIKNVNEAAGATRKSNAAVRTIIALEVGQRAAGASRTPNRIYKVPTAAPAAAGDMMEFGGEPGAGMEPGAMPTEPSMGRPMDFSASIGAGRMGDGPMSEAEEQNMLLSHRYLDEAGKPIPVGAVSTGMEGGEAMPADPAAAATPVDLSMFGKEYKRIPVRMVLEMDQRHLPNLIAQCASQSLQVEVTEVRINPPDGGGASGGGLEGMRGGMGGGYGGGLGNNAAMFPDRSGLQEFNPHPEVAQVIIQGVIYIFNKPDPSAFETTDAAQVATN
jgi:hypothetical protein